MSEIRNIPLKALGLEARWPKLAALLDDFAKFEARHQKAAAQAETLRVRLPQARAANLDAAAKAILEHKKPPDATHEPTVQRDLEVAVREREVLARAVQGMHEKLGAFMAEHQPALYSDVEAARRKIAAEMAEHARATLSSYSRHENLGRVVKRLRPAAPMDENRPAQPMTSFVIGVHGAGPAGPAGGEIEGILSYLISLGAESQEGDDAAA